jgi:hydantoinase/carbamoylase family amidase
MKDRRDAYMAAAEISLLAERLARESDSPYITATVGDMRIEPGAANVIPGKAAFPLDIRSIRMEDKDKMLDGLRTGIKEIALERGVSVSESMMNHDKPVMCDPHLREIIRAAADQMKIPAMDIVSGPYHDSLMLGDITRVGMIFVPSRDGISHNRAEWTDIRDIWAGTAVLADALWTLGNEERVE